MNNLLFSQLTSASQGQRKENQQQWSTHLSRNFNTQKTQTSHPMFNVLTKEFFLFIFSAAVGNWGRLVWYLEELALVSSSTRV